MSALVTHRVPASRRPSLIAGVVLITIGLGMMLLAHETVAGWVFLLPGGLLVLLGTQPVGVPVEAIIVDDMGLSDRTLELGPIPWDQVIRADARQLRRFPVVALQLTDNDAWLARLPERHRKLVALGAAQLGLPPVFLYAVQLDVPVLQIVAAINERARGSSR